MWDECNCAVIWAFFGIAFLWNWNENWPFPVLWPLLSFPNLLASWVQHFQSIIFQDLKQLNWNSITSASFVRSDASVMSIPFLSFIEPILAWNVPLAFLIFLKRSLVFPILFFSSISLPGLLRKAFYLSLLFFETLHSDAYIFPFLLCFSPLFFSQLFVRPPQTATLLFSISFPWGWSWSLSPVQCHGPPSIVYQALCLSDLVP